MHSTKLPYDFYVEYLKDIKQEVDDLSSIKNTLITEYNKMIFTNTVVFYTEVIETLEELIAQRKKQYEQIRVQADKHS